MTACVALLVPCAARADQFGPSPGAPYTLPGSQIPSEMVSADFNGDGQSDLAVATSDASDTIRLGVLLANSARESPGKPVVSTAIGFTGGWSTTLGGDTLGTLVTGDFNGDGKPDLAVAQSSGVSIFLGDGYGNFSPAPGSPVSISGDLAVGKFSTGKPDEIAAVRDGGVSVVGQGGGGTFAVLHTTADSLADVTTAGAGAFGATTNVGLAVVNGGGATVTTLIGNGSGAFTTGASTADGLGTPCNPAATCLYDGLSAATGTFNSDTHPDLAVGSFSGQVAILLGTGSATGGFTLAPKSPITATNTQAEQLTAAPFTGGALDGLAVAGYFQGGCVEPCTLPNDSVAVLLPGGDGSFTPATGSPYDDGGVTTTVAAGDFNGDGKPDIAFGDGDSCEGNDVGVLIDLGASTAADPSTYPADRCPIPKPTVATSGPTGVSLTGATLHGVVDPHFQAITDCHFSYGIGKLDHTAKCAVSGKEGDETVSATLTGLQPLKSYEYVLSATDAGGTATTTPPATFQSCQSATATSTTSNPKYASFQALGCFTAGPNGIQVAHGPVQVNGLTFDPGASGTITIDTTGAKLRATGAGTVSIGVLGHTIPVYGWVHELQISLSSSPRTLFDVNKDSAKAIHFPITGALSAQLVGGKAADGTALHGTKITAAVSLKPIGNDNQGSLSVTTYNGLGAQGLEISVQPAGTDPSVHPWDTCNPNLKYAGYVCAFGPVNDGASNAYRLVSLNPRVLSLGPLQVTDFVAGYDFATHIWHAEAGATIGAILPGPVGKLFPTLSIGGTVGPHGLQTFHLGGANLGWDLGPFDLDTAQLDLTFYPRFGIGGQVEATILKNAPFLKKLHLEAGATIGGGFNFSQGSQSGFDLKINGTYPVFEVPVKGSVELDTRNGRFAILLGGTFTKDFDVGPLHATVTAGVNGAIQVQPSLHFQLAGDGNASAFGQSLQVHVLASDKGFAACGQVHVAFFSGDVGFKYFWGGDVDFDGCDFSGIYTVQQSAADTAAVGRTVALPHGLPREELALTGSGAPPDVTLSGPGGRTISTPAKPDALTFSPAGAAVAVTSTDTTYFILDHPAAGDWRVTPAPGASQPQSFSIRRADPLAPVRIRASVTGRSGVRRLHWRFAAQRGVSLEFQQLGGRSSEIASAGRSGSRRFTVADGPAGIRSVLALVYVDGELRQRLTVARFRSPAIVPALPHPHRASWTIRHRKLLVAWSRVRGATAYLVAVRERSGKDTFRFSARTTRVTMSEPSGGVQGVAVAASTGGVGRIPYTSAQGPPKPKPKPKRHRR